MLNGVVAVVNSFTRDLSRREQDRHYSMRKELSMRGPAKGLGMCESDPLATEFALILTTTLLCVVFLFGLPLLVLQYRDYCVKFYVKRMSRQLRLQHEAENLRDLRSITTRAVEEQLLGERGMDRHGQSEPSSAQNGHLEQEGGQGAQGGARADPEAPSTVPPPISVKPKLAELKRVGRNFNLPQLEIDSEGAVLFKKEGESAKALKAGKKLLAEEAQAFVSTKATLLEKARARVKARAEAEVRLEK
jgi:hypothetical protein